MADRPAGKTKLQLIDKIILGGLIVSALLLLGEAVAPGPLAATWHSAAAPFIYRDPDRNWNGNYLHNGDFSAGSREIGPDVDDSLGEGQLANEWTDVSDDYVHGLHYSMDKTTTRNGHPVQRIDIPRACFPNMVQLTQTRVLPIGHYTISVWIRSSKQMPAAVELADADLQPVMEVRTTVSHPWMKVEMSGWNWNWGEYRFIVSATKPGSLWVADADMHRDSDIYLDWVGIVVLVALAVLAVNLYIARSLSAAGRGSITVRIGGAPDDAKGKTKGETQAKK